MQLFIAESKKFTVVFGEKNILKKVAGNSGRITVFYIYQEGKLPFTGCPMPVTGCRLVACRVQRGVIYVYFKRNTGCKNARGCL